MDENKGQMGQYQGCGMCCGHGHGHGNFALRLILGLAILFIVFWVGVQIGEFKASLEGGYGSYGMHDMMYYRTAAPMMLQGSAGWPVTSTTPAAQK